MKEYFKRYVQQKMFGKSFCSVNLLTIKAQTKCIKIPETLLQKRTTSPVS